MTMTLRLGFRLSSVIAMWPASASRTPLLCLACSSASAILAAGLKNASYLSALLTSMLDNMRFRSRRSYSSVVASFCRNSSASFRCLKDYRALAFLSMYRCLEDLLLLAVPFAILKLHVACLVALKEPAPRVLLSSVGDMPSMAAAVNFVARFAVTWLAGMVLAPAAGLDVDCMGRAEPVRSSSADVAETETLSLGARKASGVHRSSCAIARPIDCGLRLACAFVTVNI